MERRTLGHGLCVSAEGLGCKDMSEFYRVGDDDESVAAERHQPSAAVNLNG
jgi:aryl-alcohol dehydrogenase-like predicted oxidoreductase